MRFPHHYREYAVGHSYEGFTLNVTDRWLPGWLAETVLGALLGALGHPCCGRGLGRIEVINAAAYRLLSNVANWGISRDRRRVHVPLTVDQAITLAPWYRDSIGPEVPSPSTARTSPATSGPTRSSLPSGATTAVAFLTPADGGRRR